MSLLLLLFCAVSWTRAVVYHTERTFWSDTVLKSPGKARPHYGLGDALNTSGDLEAAQHHLKQALAIQPDYPDALSNLATIYCRIGRESECYELLQAARSLNPRHLWTRYKLALYYYQKGLLDDARREFNVVLQINPFSKEARFAGRILTMIQRQQMRR